MPKRIDEALVAYGLAESIERARLYVLEGRVYLGAGKVKKASDPYKDGLRLTVRGLDDRYVSRGAHKLEGAFDAFGLDARGRVCIDVGASTGGFTQVLLERGAKTVYAVDVGFGLLDWSLRRDPRVLVMERVNARALNSDMFPVRPSLGATDVSFISLKAVLPPVLNVLSGPDRQFVALIKPQFEARREQVGAGGIVRDVAVLEEVALSVAAFIRGLRWCVAGFQPSPITGAQGNIEFLARLVPESAAEAVAREEICQTVREAYDKFMTSP